VVLVLRSDGDECTRTQAVLASNDLSRIYPFHAGLSNDDFLAMQRYYRTDYQGLRTIIVDATAQLPEQQQFGYYFESLNTGAWIGLNERERFEPLSLRKVPLMVALYRQIEIGAISLDDRVVIEESDIDWSYGPLAERGAGQSLTVRELLWYVAYHSDNTAAQVVLRLVGDDEYVQALLRMGVSVSTFRENANDMAFPLSAKEFAGTFRSLYYSGYLSRVHSQEVLDLLSQTSFVKGLPAGVPAGIVVAHKTASLSGQEPMPDQHHDCGIIYYPNSPYLLCVMTRGMTQEESDSFIANLSQATYQYVDSSINTT
jgi:beta-lactamase class A